MKVKLNDTFPGDSKGKIKDLDAHTAKSIVDNGWGELVEKEDKEAEARKDKTDKAATGKLTK